MKLELNRDELTEAVKCYVSKQGINVENKEVSIKVSRNITIVTIKELKVESESQIEKELKEPFDE